MKVIDGENMPFVRGKKHTYVGMDFKYSSPVEVIVSMDNYIAEVIEKFPEEKTKIIKTPAVNHLLEVDDACVKL